MAIGGPEVDAAAATPVIEASSTQLDCFARIVRLAWGTPMIARDEGNGVVPARSTATPRACRQASRAVLLLAMAALSSFGPARVALAGEPGTSGPAVGERVQALIPELEAYVATGMKAFDVPGVALGIIAGDELVYAKGFGVRSKAGGIPVDTRTIFQIGSTTKAFLATAIAMMVDRGKLRWDDRVVDLEPDFQLKDAWVTREFRVFDLLAQRSGLPPTPTTCWACWALRRRP